MVDGIGSVEARIQEIQGMLGALGGSAAGGMLGSDAPTGATNPASFSDALNQAQGTAATGATAATDTNVPTSSGSLNRAGVDSVGWARDFLKAINMPITSENVRAITAWEQAEGTAAHFNPLATCQGGFAGETNFNSVGVKNYASYQDGITANAHGIENGRYSNILAALKAGNNAMAVAQAIANSPWGTGSLVEKILASQK
jgi:hypothetical protein